jgi:hypothetical protein
MKTRNGRTGNERRGSCAFWKIFSTFGRVHSCSLGHVLSGKERGFLVRGKGNFRFD